MLTWTKISLGIHAATLLHFCVRSMPRMRLYLVCFFSFHHFFFTMEKVPYAQHQKGVVSVVKFHIPHYCTFFFNIFDKFWTCIQMKRKSLWGAEAGLERLEMFHLQRSCLKSLARQAKRKWIPSVAQIMRQDMGTRMMMRLTSPLSTPSDLRPSCTACGSSASRAVVSPALLENQVQLLCFFPLFFGN